MIGRRRRQADAWLDGWEAVAVPRFHHWADLDGEERDRLGGDVEWLVRTRRWEAARGFDLSQEVVVTIAAHAALPLLGLDRHAYRDVRAVVVHPRTIVVQGPRSTSIPGVVVDGPRRVLGHAQDRRGPVVLSWAAVRADVRRPGRGRNVVLHELAHKLDAADGAMDGAPALGDPASRAVLAEASAAALERVRAGAGDPDPVLRAYAGESPSELFAVATEVFFERPLELQDREPDLYGALSAYYRQDPAARVRRR